MMIILAEMSIVHLSGLVLEAKQKRYVVLDMVTDTERDIGHVVLIFKKVVKDTLNRLSNWPDAGKGWVRRIIKNQL